MPELISRNVGPLEPLDVLAVGAHPDDCEIACGGTLAKLVQQGYRVGLIDLTDGEPTPHSPGPDVRIAEAFAAADLLGLQVREILPLPNRKLFDSFENRIELAKRIRVHKPKIVIGLGDKTPLASPDHYQATLITDAAIFYSRLTKWDHYFDGLPVHAVQRQLYFRFPFENPSLPGFESQITVDITDTLELKLQAIGCYRTQFPPEKAYIFDRVRGAAWAIGGNSGIGAGEVFVSAKPLWVDDLVSTLLG